MQCKRWSWEIVCLVLSVLLLNSMSAAAEDTAKVWYVYDETENENNVWYPSGWMPDGSGIFFTDRSEGPCYRGETCIEAGAQLTSKPYWRGIYWLPVGSWKGPGINVYEKLGVDETAHIKLTFWVKGQTGKERIQFKVGGVADGKDSIRFPVETDYMTLPTKWEQKEIDLEGKDLKNIVGGFCWVTNKDQNQGQNEVVFFLDDIRYEVVE